MKTVEKIYVVGIPNTELSFNPVSTYQDANEIWIFPITQHEKRVPEDYLSADAIGVPAKRYSDCISGYNDTAASPRRYREALL